MSLYSSSISLLQSSTTGALSTKKPMLPLIQQSKTRHALEVDASCLAEENMPNINPNMRNITNR